MLEKRMRFLLNYMFNWVGNLSSYDRQLASKILSKELLTLQERYPDSKINLYGHSHGGNVILNALHILKKSNFQAHNIIFFGMPIGKKTAKIINTIKYKTLYNFYSDEDIVQNKDFTFDMSTMICGRTIKKSNIDLYNIKVKRNDKSPLHHGMFFISHDKGLGYPTICDIPILLFFLDCNNKKNWQSEEYEYCIN